MKFPRRLFVRIDCSRDGESIIACSNPLDAVEDDGPTIIAEYELSGVPKKYSKELVETK